MKVNFSLIIEFFLLISFQKWSDCFQFRINKFRCISSRLSAQKFDPNDIITITVAKPLGLSLEEFEEGSSSGVYIA